MKKKFKDLVERNRWMKAIPNSLTLCNSLCGFASILITLQAYKYVNNTEVMANIFAWSAAMILFAMVFDSLDGYAARLLNAASLHGIQMDSLSDMVTFGVAPATLVAVMAHNVKHLDTLRLYIPVCILCAIYLGGAALRLATYNVHAMEEKKSSERFSGIPSPGAAAAICSIVIFVAIRDSNVERLMSWLPIYAAVLGLLMVSKVPYMHFAKWVVSTKRNKRRLFFLILLLVSWGASAAFIPNGWIIAPVILINAYVIWGPLAFLAVKMGFIKPHADLTPDIAEHEPEKDN